MDGMSKNDNILVLAAPTSHGDRPGASKTWAFEEAGIHPPPDLESRKAIFEIYLKKLPIEADIDAEYLAGVTQAFQVLIYRLYAVMHQRSRFRKRFLERINANLPERI